MLPAIGIFVGGQGRRMGGVAKANLAYEGRTLLERTLEACRSAAHAIDGAAAVPRIYLVGESSAYSAPGLLRLADDPAGVGPMGGLRALLAEAARQQLPALALAGDLPFLTPSLLGRLCLEAQSAAALAPCADGRWEPLFARYSPEAVLPELDAALSQQQTALQSLFHRLGARALALPLSGAEWRFLRDWDRPSDMLAASRP
jgi:molybdopterin-guanine dinucleotide biosynthesis protein A